MRMVGSGYQLGTLIGRGSTGEVWAGETSGDGRPIAVKILNPELAADRGAVARFVQEGQILTSVRSPGLVQVHDLIAGQDTLGIVMDLVDGPDLRTFTSQYGTLPPALAAELIGQVLGALSVVHRAGIIHRDLKPENILVDLSEPGRPRALLTDFGVAMVTSDPDENGIGLAGTLPYLAPEVAQQGQASPASDLYSIGVVLYELLAGRTPFPSIDPYEILRAHQEDHPPAIPGLPAPLQALLDGLLAKNPAARPPSAIAARQLLTQAAASAIAVQALAPMPSASSYRGPTIPPTGSVPIQYGGMDDAELTPIGASAKAAVDAERAVKARAAREARAAQARAAEAAAAAIRNAQIAEAEAAEAAEAAAAAAARTNSATIVGLLPLPARSPAEYETPASFEHEAPDSFERRAPGSFEHGTPGSFEHGAPAWANSFDSGQPAMDPEATGKLFRPLAAAPMPMAAQPPFQSAWWPPQQGDEVVDLYSGAPEPDPGLPPLTPAYARLHDDGPPYPPATRDAALGPDSGYTPGYTSAFTGSSGLAGLFSRDGDSGPDARAFPGASLFDGGPGFDQPPYHDPYGNQAPYNPDPYNPDPYTSDPHSDRGPYDGGPSGDMPLRPASRRNRWWLLPAVLGVAAAAGLVALVITLGGKDADPPRTNQVQPAAVLPEATVPAGVATPQASPTAAPTAAASPSAAPSPAASPTPSPATTTTAPPAKVTLITMPKLTGLSLAAANSRLSARGLPPASVTKTCSGSVPAGQVLTQSRKPGTKVKASATVSVTVQDDCAVVPDLDGMTLADAVKLLRQDGFTQLYRIPVRNGTPADTDLVDAQYPSAGTSQLKDAPVYLRAQPADPGNG